MISRDVEGAARRQFELAIVGGGIHGAALLYEAARRGISACLCEAEDFGGGTSQHSLRILHGGLRYLQTLHLTRFFQSVAARREFARRFPELVRVLPCLMPLYAGGGMKTPLPMRAALLANDVLGARRNAGLPPRLRLPRGTVVDVAETRLRFPGVRTARLRGAALWTDYFMVSSERILMELLRAACAAGAVALNRARVTGLRADAGRVQALLVEDASGARSVEIAATHVVNCAGPRAPALMRDLPDAAGASLFQPSLAFNVLLDARLPVDCALAVAAPQPGAAQLFLVPQQGSVLAGTMHLPRPAGTTEAVPTEAEIESYLAMLRAAIPGFDARSDRVRHVFAGLLPARATGSAQVSKREVLLDHAAHGGLAGVLSLAPVKYTTATDVAEQILTKLGLARAPRGGPDALPLSPATPVLTESKRLWRDDAASLREALRATWRDEAVQNVDDLIYRRTNWSTTALDIARVRARVTELMG